MELIDLAKFGISSNKIKRFIYLQNYLFMICKDHKYLFKKSGLQFKIIKNPIVQKITNMFIYQDRIYFINTQGKIFNRKFIPNEAKLDRYMHSSTFNMINDIHYSKLK